MQKPNITAARILIGVVLVGLIFAGGFYAGGYLNESPKAPAETEPKQVPEKVVVVPPPSANEVYAARKKLWKRSQPDLDWAEQESLAAARAFIDEVNQFFVKAKDKCPEFAESALSWQSKWKAIADHDAHRDFLTGQFEKLIFSEKELRDHVAKASIAFDQRIVEIETELIKRTRTSAEQAAEAGQLFAVDQTAFLAMLNERIGQLTDDIVFSNEVDLAKLAAKRFATKLTAQMMIKVSSAMLVRAGISSATTGASAAGGVASMGTTLVVGFIVDRIVNWICDWYQNPSDDITQKLAAAISKTRTELLNGNDEAWESIKKLETVSKLHEDEAVRQRASDAIGSIQQSGNLGLRFGLEQFFRQRFLNIRNNIKAVIFDEVKP